VLPRTTRMLHPPYQFPEPTTVTLCFLWNGVRDVILLRRLSMLRHEGRRSEAFAPILGALRGVRLLKQGLQQARSMKERKMEVAGGQLCAKVLTVEPAGS
jgi:hypothetical protein